MNTTSFRRLFVAVLTFALIAPSAFLLVPQKVSAQGVGVPIVGVGANEFTTSAKTVFIAIKSTLTQINTFTTAAATYANYINTYYLQPLAFVLSGNLMKMLTASVIGFVIGKANGTGIPQFVVDVRKSMQTVSDGQALAYLRQVGQTNSPFAGSISSALNTDYLTKSSLAGFWAANMCTLNATSIPTYAPDYLNGNWSHGGVSAWFALTTQVHNNPFTLYQDTQAQLGNVIGSGVGGATGARQQELSWGQGFMSWCSSSDAASGTAAGALSAMDNCIAQGNTPAYCDKTFANAGGAVGGINPGDACTNSDGTAGSIKTPGTVIKATLDKVLGGQQDSILRMGDIGSQINSILKDVGSVVSTVNFASSLLGGSSGGLFGSSQTSSANPTSRLAGFTPTQNSSGGFTSGYLGATNAQIAADQAASPVVAANNMSTTTSVAEAAAPVSTTGGTVSSDMLSRMQDYQTAWGTISVAANAASSTVQSLAALCTSYGNSNQVVAAHTALVGTITPVLTQAAGVPAVVAAALAQDTLVKGDVPASAAYTADLQKLQTMSPTYMEVSAAQYDATSYGSATASPVGSLTVSGGSITDRMNLIRTNAEALKISACTASPNIGGGWNGM